MPSLRLLVSSSLLSTLLFAVACKKEAPAPVEKPVETPAVAEPTPPAPPPAPVYSPEAVAKLMPEIEACRFASSCPPLDVLVGFGDQVAPELAKLALDTSKSTDSRKVAAEGLQKVKAADAGPALVQAAQAEKDFMLRGELFAAAGASGNPKVLELAAAHLLTDAGNDMSVEEIRAIEPFGKAAFDWAIAELGKKGKNRTNLADVVRKTASPADLPALQAVLAKEKDQMVANRLASRAAELGDSKAYTVLLHGLASKDEYDRSDAAGMLVPVIDNLPADLKAQTIELLKAGKAADQGGLTARAYDEALKKLGAS